jgi:hypothetical protein
MGPWLVEVTEMATLEPWLDSGMGEKPEGSAMIVRGDDALVRVFLPNALDAAKLEPGRVVMWVKDPSLFGEDVQRRLFGRSGSAVAAVVATDGRVGGWVSRDRIGVEDAAFAYAEAEERRG